MDGKYIYLDERATTNSALTKSFVELFGTPNETGIVEPSKYYKDVAFAAQKDSKKR